MPRVPVRRAFTLLELLLVLALIVAIAAVALPAIFGPLENYRLRKAADIIRVQFGKARSEAMRSGQTIMVRFHAADRAYEMQPWYSSEDYLESSNRYGLGTPGTAAAAFPGASASQATLTPTARPPATGVLPEGVLFQGLQATAAVRDAQIQQAVQTQPGQTSDWSPPVLFYPDGTSSTVRVILGNTRQYYVEIRLRGLSGIADVTDLLTAAEVGQ